MRISDWSSDVCSSDLSLAAQADQLRADCATAIFMGVGSKVAGIFAIADPIKPTTPEALAALRADGIKVVMLPGYNRTTAEAVARLPGSDADEADVLPDQKAAVRELGSASCRERV